MPLPRMGTAQLTLVREPFDHPDYLFELKHDGFRALACVSEGHCELVSRRRNRYKIFAELRENRAYIACGINLPTLSKEGEKLHLAVTIRNAGKSTAVDVETESRLVIVLGGTSEETARTQAFLSPLQERASNSTLASEQQSEQILESQIPLTASLIADITAEKAIVYAFSETKYEDVFSHKHHTKTCGYYSPVLKAIATCHTLNKAD